MISPNIIKLINVDSTNSYALSLKKNEIFKEGLVVTSDFQSNGMGQRNSFWESDRGVNLLMSIVVEPNIKILDQFDLIKISSLSIAQILESLSIKSKIKWPNDILVDSQKIAGVLIHNIISGKILTHSIIGIGLNINQISFDEYSPMATSLKKLKNNNFNIDDIRSSLIARFFHNLRLYRSAKDFSDEYQDLLFQKNKIAVFEDKNKRFNGKIKGVKKNGILLVELNDKIREFDLKEIKMIF